jgi:hypothetical protein
VVGHGLPGLRAPAEARPAREGRGQSAAKGVPSWKEALRVWLSAPLPPAPPLRARRTLRSLGRHLLLNKKYMSK